MRSAEATDRPRRRAFHWGAQGSTQVIVDGHDSQGGDVMDRRRTSRRDFLRLSVVLAGGTALLTACGGPPPAPPPTPAPTQTPRARKASRTPEAGGAGRRPGRDSSRARREAGRP